MIFFKEKGMSGVFIEGEWDPRWFKKGGNEKEYIQIIFIFFVFKFEKRNKGV